MLTIGCFHLGRAIFQCSIFTSITNHKSQIANHKCTPGLDLDLTRPFWRLRGADDEGGMEMVRIGVSWWEMVEMVVGILEILLDIFGGTAVHGCRGILPLPLPSVILYTEYCSRLDDLSTYHTEYPSEPRINPHARKRKSYEN